MTHEGFSGFKGEVVHLGRESREASSDPVLEELKGPLIEMVKTLPREQIDTIDRDILNMNGLSLKALEWVTEESSARGIFQALQGFLTMDKSGEEGARAYREEAKKIANLIDA